MNDKVLITVKHDNFKDLLLVQEIKSDGLIWFSVPNCVSSPNIDLVIEELKTQIGKISNSHDEIEKELNNYFQSFINEIELFKNKNKL